MLEEFHQCLCFFAATSALSSLCCSIILQDTIIMSCPLVRLQHAHIIWSTTVQWGQVEGGQQATITVDFSFLCKAVRVFLSYSHSMPFFFIHRFYFPFLPLAPFLVSLILAFWLCSKLLFLSLSNSGCFSPSSHVPASDRSLLQDKEPRGIIPLENLSIREVEEPRKPVSVAWLETSAFLTKSSLCWNISSPKIIIWHVCFWWPLTLSVPPSELFWALQPESQGPGDQSL